MNKLALLLVAVSMAGGAQTAGSIQATGNATINARPDQATLTVGVVTQASTAQDAAQTNAAASDAMIKALQAKLGSSGTIQTIYYSLSPRYSNGTNTQPPVIVGYTATNTVQVVTTNLSLVGPLIDAGNQAGANNIGGPTFGLQNPDPQMQQALSAAAKQALAHAGAIAAGLGAKTGAVISAQEGGSVTPIVMNAAGGAAVGTPIQTGTVTVSATVTVTVSLVQ
jgi:uncharacterized protein YggE